MLLGINECMYDVNNVALRRIGVKGLEIRKPDQLKGVDCLIIPGGESTTMAKLAELHNLVSISPYPISTHLVIKYILPTRCQSCTNFVWYWPCCELIYYYQYQTSLSTISLYIKERAFYQFINSVRATRANYVEQSLTCDLLSTSPYLSNLFQMCRSYPLFLGDSIGIGT